MYYSFYMYYTEMHVRDGAQKPAEYPRAMGFSYVEM